MSGVASAATSRQQAGVRGGGTGACCAPALPHCGEAAIPSAYTPLTATTADELPAAWRAPINPDLLMFMLFILVLVAGGILWARSSRANELRRLAAQRISARVDHLEQMLAQLAAQLAAIKAPVAAADMPPLDTEPSVAASADAEVPEARNAAFPEIEDPVFEEPVLEDQVPEIFGTAEDGAQPLATQDASAEPAAPVIARASEGRSYSAPAASAPLEPLSWLQKLMAGNMLAKAGVVLLFFGAASGLKMAADHGLFHPIVRLVLAALAGAALVAFGYNRARTPEKESFGYAAQGGGFAVLYLALYFAFARYGYVPAAPAFIGFALLGIGCTLLALRQNSQVLAGFGIAGAFFAPALASSGGGQPFVLFSHFLLLGLFIAGISYHKSWKSLNLLGFGLTALFGFVWAAKHYRPEYQWAMEIFLAGFFLLYTLTPALLAYYRRPSGQAWVEGTLLFGAPAAAMMAQSGLGFSDHHNAMASFAVGLYYLGLRWLIRDSADKTLHLAFSGLALAFLSLAAPLAFGQAVTSVVYAMEGAALLAFGLHHKRPIAVLTGVGIQAAAGLALVTAAEFGHTPTLFLNSMFLGAVILSLSGLVSARMLHRHVADSIAQAGALAWAVSWWYLGGVNEAVAHLGPAARPAAQLAWIALGAVLLELFSARAKWAVGRYGTVMLWPALCAALYAIVTHGGHLSGWMIGAFPLSIATAYWMLQRQELAGLTAAKDVRHLTLYWAAVAGAVMEGYWQAAHFAPNFPVYSGVAAMAGLLLAVGVIRYLQRRQAWPVAGTDDGYRDLAVAPTAVLLALGTIALNVGYRGEWHLPYLPLINPLDIASVLALAVLWDTWKNASASWKRQAPAVGPTVLAVLGLLWTSTLWARTSHYYFGVPFYTGDMWHSGIVQGGVSLLWTASAIAVVIYGSRKASRPAWFAGVGLLGLVGLKLLFVDLGQSSLAVRTVTLLGVGGLTLLAGYLAPIPPREREAQQAPG